MISIDKTNELIKQLNYPENYMFDAKTLLPEGVLSKRVELMKENIPELFTGGTSLLDIGCNKGYFSLLLSKKYKRIVGYDVDVRMIEIARDVKSYHGIKNVEFNVGGLVDISNRSRYETVYLGGVHHLIFAQEVNSGLDPMNFIRKLKKIAKKYIIIDGVMNYWDFAFLAIRKDYNYQPNIYEQYTLENIKKILAPTFQFLKDPWDGIGIREQDRKKSGYSGRHCAVFIRK